MPTEKLGEQYEFTTPVQLYFAGGLYKPSVMPGVANALPKFNCWFIFDRNHPDYKPLGALLRKVAAFKLQDVKFCMMPLSVAETANMQLRFTQNPGYSHPLLQGDRIIEAAAAKGKSIEALTGAVAGKMVLAGRSGEDYPPRLGGIVNGVPRDFDGPMRDAQRAQFYNGVLVYPKVYLRVYEAFGGGVSCRISSVFSTGEGERLAGGEGASTIPTGYKPHSGQQTNEDPLADASQDDF
jgi:hypothetical protein